MKITSICAAPDWFAAHKNGDIGHFPLICWALVKGEEGEDEVVGLVIEPDGNIVRADHADNFATYLHKSSISN